VELETEALRLKACILYAQKQPFRSRKIVQFRVSCSQAPPDDVDVAVGAGVGGEDVVVRDDDDLLGVPHLPRS